jgi:hypothetical protein
MRPEDCREDDRLQLAALGTLARAQIRAQTNYDEEQQEQKPIPHTDPLLWCLHGSIYQRDDLTFRGLRKGCVRPLNCRPKAW